MNNFCSKLYLLGAGGWGKAFVNRKEFIELKKRYNEIVFFDNDLSLDKKICGEFRIDKNIWKALMPEDVLIITSGYWEEIYEECILRGIQDVKIYDGNRDIICSYKEMCIYYKTTYKNMKFFRYYADREYLVNKAVEQFNNEEGGLFENMTQVAIMLSNLCNYANIHSKCPASLAKDKEIMQSKYVYKILDELAQNAFCGIICFHTYNEPMIDPRLFMFIKYAKKKMLDIKIMIYSNGYYLNKVMIEELGGIGVDVLIVTGYGDSEFSRLISLDDGNMPYQVVWGNLDNRLDYYDNTDKADCGICRANLFQVTIFSNGDVGTCCLDHRHTYNLGNVFTASLEEIVNSPKMHDFQKRLLKGNRMMFPICQGCGWNL